MVQLSIGELGWHDWGRVQLSSGELAGMHEVLGSISSSRKRVKILTAYQAWLLEESAARSNTPLDR